MAKITRRGFLVGAAAAGTAFWAGGRAASAATAATVRRGTDLVTLGRSGLKTTLLGLGTGTKGGSEQRNLGQEGFTRLFRHGLDRGIRYVDTADAYRTHAMVREALKGVPRERYFIQTKTRARAADAARADLDRFRQELGIEYFDSLLMHCMTKASWATDMRPVMDELLKAKQQGIVKAVGISCHGWDPLASSVESDWVQIQLARINPFDLMLDGKYDAVAAELKKMHDKGRGIIGMKVFGETGLGTAERRLEALRYVLGLGSVDAFTIGFSTPEQVDETLALIEKASAAPAAAWRAPRGEAVAVA